MGFNSAFKGLNDFHASADYKNGLRSPSLKFFEDWYYCILHVKIHFPRRILVDNIRMDLQEVGCGYVDWIGLAQDRDRWRTLVSAVMSLRVP